MDPHAHAAEQLEPGCAMTLAWGALLHDVGKPPTFREAPDRIRFDGHVEVGVAIGAEICRRFRFSNDETQPDSRADRESHALRRCAAHEGFDSEALFSSARIFRSIWRCIAWTAWRRTAIWTSGTSCASAMSRCLKRLFVPASAHRA